MSWPTKAEAVAKGACPRCTTDRQIHHHLRSSDCPAVKA